jgi:hypothetical protein
MDSLTGTTHASAVSGIHELLRSLNEATISAFNARWAERRELLSPLFQHAPRSACLHLLGLALHGPAFYSSYQSNPPTVHPMASNTEKLPPLGLEHWDTCQRSKLPRQQRSELKSHPLSGPTLGLPVGSSRPLGHHSRFGCLSALPAHHFHTPS